MKFVQEMEEVRNMKDEQEMKDVQEMKGVQEKSSFYTETLNVVRYSVPDEFNHKVLAVE